MRYVMTIGFLLLMACSVVGSEPGRTSQCILPNYCLCVTDSLKAGIDQKAQQFIDEVRAAHAAKRFAIYLSVPLSSSGGSDFMLNREVAGKIAEALGDRFGSDRIYVLNPSRPDADLPQGEAKQPDYGYLWARVIEGAIEAGSAFDLIYFAGPSDFARALHLNGSNDLAWLSAYFAYRQQSDPKFAEAVKAGTKTEQDFVAYYGFRASTTFSAGAHDEWNLVAQINAERTVKPEGVGKQIAVLFDGRALPPPTVRIEAAPGNVGKCP